MSEASYDNWERLVRAVLKVDSYYHHGRDFSCKSVNFSSDEEPSPESFVTSFDHFLWDIREAFIEKESAIDYDYLAPKLFEQRGSYDSQVQARVDSSNLAVEEIIGRNHEKQKLLSELSDPGSKKGTQLSIISILGPCGIGKTAFAKAVKEMFELRVWVKVDGQEFNLRRKAQEILKSTTGMLCFLDDLDELDEMVRDVLHSFKCLIVFDEVDSMENELWIHIEQFWFNVVGLGSKVLITTTCKDVAHLVANQSIELSELSSYAGWLLCAYSALDSADSIKDIPAALAKKVSALCQDDPFWLKPIGKFDKIG